MESAEDRDAARLGRPTALLLGLVMVVGLMSSVAAVLSDRGKALIGGFGLTALLDGEATMKLARLLNEDLAGGHELATAARALDWLVVGDLGLQVRRGCGNWLFLREELDIHRDGGAASSRRVAMVDGVNRLLAARGIHLVVAITPDKSRMKTDALCQVGRPASLAGRFDAFAAGLGAAGIDNVDLRAALSAADEGGYYHTDTHWSEAGAKAAAQAIARHLEAEQHAPVRGADVPVIAGEVKERVGDLIRLAGLDGVSPPFRPTGDRTAISTITMPAIIADDLFGDMAGPPLAVIGSSYSRTANFIGFLAAELAAPVADMARDGAGFAGAAMPYFADGAFTATPPKVVIWEIPERILDAPLTAQEIDWERRLASGAL
ncbi:alginate O-acetyltransferase AlgX-related protein [Zavarzinia sp.]|uniref:alginate O-acetyltransferase AlgX-related protein n=1 Tax=Zavarzinia sp. TaxID=2027920 RepID=UPI003BB65CE3|nr:hypothetical protein [Zavarzinia sp.]